MSVKRYRAALDHRRVSCAAVVAASHFRRRRRDPSPLLRPCTPHGVISSATTNAACRTSAVRGGDDGRIEISKFGKNFRDRLQSCLVVASAPVVRLCAIVH
ncbi:hypothetical protein ACI65C_004052 [Semiaphis heraclei]